MLFQRKYFINIWLILSITSLFVSSGICQDEKPNSRAQKYFDLLIKNPVGDYLYDSFYDAWLDTGTVEGLEQFLKQKDTLVKL